MAQATRYAVILTTTGSAAEAEGLSEALVTERLAACVQATPVRSRYMWKGELQRDDEVLLLIKTRADLFEAVRARVRALSAYETPELVMLPVAAGDADYLAWIAAGTSPA